MSTVPVRARSIDKAVGAAVDPAVDNGRSVAAVVEEIPVLTMVEPMAGFPDLSRFTLVRLDDEGVLCALRSVEEPDLRFLVVPVHLFFPDYTPLVRDEAVAALGIETAEDVLTLVVVNPGDGSGATANLLAPVLINTKTLQAGQVVLEEDLPVRAPLMG